MSDRQIRYRQKQIDPINFIILTTNHIYLYTQLNTNYPKNSNPILTIYMAERRRHPQHQEYADHEQPREHVRGYYNTKQFTLGSEEQTAQLYQERHRLLEERRNLRGLGNTHLPGGYYDDSPSPKFKSVETQQSQPVLIRGNMPLNHPHRKLADLKPYLEKLAGDSYNENSEVQKGLHQLRNFYQNIMKQLVELAQQSQQSPPEATSKVTLDRAKQLKDHIERIIADCQNESQQVRESLEHLKQMQEEAIVDIETGEPMAYSLSNHEPKQTNNHLQPPRKSPQNGNISAEGAERSRTNSQQVSANQRLSTHERAGTYENQNIHVRRGSTGSDVLTDRYEQLDVLSNLEGRIVTEVQNLRQTKNTLEIELNNQIRYANETLKKMSKLEKENQRLKETVNQLQHRIQHEDSEVENESIINKLDNKNANPQHPLAKLDAQNHKLKEKIRHLESQLLEFERIEASKRQTSRDEEVVDIRRFRQLQERLAQAQEDRDLMARELDVKKRQIAELRSRQSAGRRSDESVGIANLKNEIHQLEQHLRDEEARNARLEGQLRKNSSHNPQVENNLNKLKQQNDLLRAETIRLLKRDSSKNDDSGNAEEIRRLRSAVAHLEEELRKYRSRDSYESNNHRGSYGNPSQFELEETRPIRNRTQGLQEYRDLLHGLRNGR